MLSATEFQEIAFNNFVMVNQTKNDQDAFPLIWMRFELTIKIFENFFIECSKCPLNEVPSIHLQNF